MNILTHRIALGRSHRVSLLHALAVYRQRRALARLDDHALNDIGLTRAQAEAEANRSFFDVFRL